MPEPTKPSKLDMAANLLDCLAHGALPGDLEAACRQAIWFKHRCRVLEKLLKLADDVICEATWGQKGSLASTSDKIRKALATPSAAPGEEQEGTQDG